MCISARKVKRAEKEIKIFKVLLANGCTIFKTLDGSDNVSYTRGQFTIDFNIIIQTKAIGFCRGYGFSVFEKREYAEHYKRLIEKDKNLSLQIREYKIPKGSLYAIGIVERGYIGGGLSAIRCEELKQITRRTK